MPLRNPLGVHAGYDLLEFSLHESLEITAGLGGSHLTGALCSACGHDPKPLSAAGRATVVSVPGRLARAARGTGVTLGLVIGNRYETNVVTGHLTAVPA